jgi:hypothetical protein
MYYMDLQFLFELPYIDNLLTLKFLNLFLIKFSSFFKDFLLINVLIFDYE